jgi:hypothetical protein
MGPRLFSPGRLRALVRVAAMASMVCSADQARLRVRRVRFGRSRARM